MIDAMVDETVEEPTPADRNVFFPKWVRGNALYPCRSTPLAGTVPCVPGSPEREKRPSARFEKLPR